MSEITAVIGIGVINARRIKRESGIENG